MPANDATKPAGWLPVHDTFVKDLAKKGEDANSILILLEAECSSLQGKVSVAWIRTRMT